MNNYFNYRRAGVAQDNNYASGQKGTTGPTRDKYTGRITNTIDTMQKVDPTIAAALVPGYNPNPNVKPSGAPTPFSPNAAQTINNAFGMPIDGSYDRAMGIGNPTQPQDM